MIIHQNGPMQPLPSVPRNLILALENAKARLLEHENLKDNVKPGFFWPANLKNERVFNILFLCFYLVIINHY